MVNLEFNDFYVLKSIRKYFQIIGEAVYEPMLIAKNYLKSWFALDCISAMPYDLLIFGSGNIDVKF
jgi:hypothetical protein